MSFLSEQPDRQGMLLARLASLSFELAENLQQRAIEAESVEDAVRLSSAFAQVSRGLRQSLALDMKLIRFRREIAAVDAEAARKVAEAQEAAAAAEQAVQARERKACQIRDLVEPLIWNEYERPEAEDLQDRFEHWLSSVMTRFDYDRCPPGALAGEIADILDLPVHDDAEDEEPVAPEPDERSAELAERARAPNPPPATEARADTS